MNKILSEEEYADLWEKGQAPDNPLRIVKWALLALPYGVVLRILEKSSIVYFDRPDLGKIS